MQVGAGVLGVLAVASSLAGWWLLGGIALAALLAGCAQYSCPPGDPAGDRAGRLSGGVRAGARLARVALFASVFAMYALPGSHEAAVAGFAAVVTAADAFGVRLSTYWRRWCAGLLLVAAVAFVVLCAGIEPVPHPGSAPGGVVALVASAAVAYPALAGLRGRGLGVGAVAALGVAAAALYQLGPLRLGLSPTSPRDVFAAADAQALEPVLGAVVVLATAPAALVALTEAREAVAPARGWVASVVGGGIAALVAITVTPLGAVLLAAAFALAETLVGALLTRRPGVPVYVAGALSAVCLGVLVFAV